MVVRFWGLFTLPVLLSSSAFADEMPDLKKHLSKKMCEQPAQVPGADSYFYGEFTIEGKTVKGKEQWLLYANSAWKKKGGTDCVLEWTLKGSLTEKGRCASCDFGIELEAIADVEGSNCPKELVLGRLLPTGQRAGGEGVDFKIKYDLKKDPSKVLKVYFGKSGKLLSEGYFVDNKYSWVSNHQCKWF